MRPGSITDSVFQVTTKVPTCWAFEEDDGTTTRDTGPEVTMGSSRGVNLRWDLILAPGVTSLT